MFTFLRRGAVLCGALLLVLLCAAGVAAGGANASPPEQRQIGETTLSGFKVVLTATRVGTSLNATVTAAGYQHSATGWKLIGQKRIGAAGSWFWYPVEVCGLTVTQLKPLPSSAEPSDTLTVSLLMTPALGCSPSISASWAPASPATGPAPGVTMSAAALSASTVYLAYTTASQAVYVRNAAQPGQAAIALGGRLVGGPAAVVVPAGVLSASAALAVFGRGTDNALWWRHQTASGWSNWQSLGGILTSAPGAAAGMSNQFGALNVFARGTDGVIWYRAFKAGTWGPWTSLGGAVKAGTGPGAGSGLFAIAGPDRHVRVFGRPGMQYAYIDFSGLTTATPGITNTAAGQSPVEVFARGLDNALWYRPSMLTIAPTGPWASLGGRLTSGVTATTVRGGKTYVFGLGTDNNIWMRTGMWPSLGGWMRL